MVPTCVSIQHLTLSQENNGFVSHFSTRRHTRVVTHASVPQGYTHVTANTGLARAALPRERWGGRVARGARSRRAGAVVVEPWLREPVELSRLRRGTVEALSRRCRGAVEALSRRCRGLACRACRVTVEFLSSLSSLTPCAWASSSVEVCRGLSRSVEVCRGLSSCRAVEQCRAVE